MPIMETGLFLVMASIGFGLLIMSILRSLGTMSFLFRCFSFIMFLGLAVFLTTGHDVQSTTVSEQVVLDTAGTVLTNSTNTDVSMFIPAAEGSWIGWIFFGFAIFSAILFIRDMFGVSVR